MRAHVFSLDMADREPNIYVAGNGEAENPNNLATLSNEALR